MTKHEMTLDDLLDLARRHGDDSEPDHEVGDLQDLCTAMWRVLDDEQKQQVLESDEVACLIESSDPELFSQTEVP